MTYAINSSAAVTYIFEHISYVHCSSSVLLALNETYQHSKLKISVIFTFYSNGIAAISGFAVAQ